MKISNNMIPNGVNGPTPPPAGSGSTRPTNGDAVSLTDSTALQAALQNVPDVRPEAVANAQELTANPTYPPLELIEKLALLLAENTSPEKK
jgi:hypothetical protein